MVLPAQVAIVLMAIPIVFANLWQAVNAPNLKVLAIRYWPAGLALLAGTYTGINILSSIDEKTLLLTLATIPVLAGLAVGQQIRKRVSDQHFQYLIKLVLFGSGLSMIWQAN